MLRAMKRSLWLLGSSLGALALANLPAACVSNTDTAPGGSDSGTPPEGDGGSPGSDASQPINDAALSDAGADTSIADADAAAQPLTLKVLLLGAPEQGIHVVFQDATGVVITSADTDATGTVTQLVAAGSQVTVLLGTTTSPNLVTLTDVAPGDVLTVVDTENESFSSNSVSFTLPAPTWDASGSTEQVHAGSCQVTLPGILYPQPFCQSGGVFPVLARALDSTGQELAYTYQGGNVLDPDGGLPDGDTTVPVVVTRPWATSTATATITVTNPPPQTIDGGQVSTANRVSVSYSEVSGNVPLSLLSGAGSTIDDAGTQTVGYVMHPGYPDFVQAAAYDDFNTGYGSVEMIVAGATRAAATATSQSLSLDLSSLPPIVAASIDSSSAGTIAQPNVTWTSAGSLSAANGIFVQAQWYQTIPLDGGGASYVSGTWTILAPPTATSVHAPALPASFAPWIPGVGSSWTTLPRVGAIKASFVPGYAALRAQFGSLPFMSGYQIVVPTLPVNGTIYVSGIYPNEG